MDSHPFSAAYWRMAAGELKNVRKLTFAALCMALCMALSAIPSVPLWGGAKITWGFLARAVCAWVCGPVLGLVFGAAEDLLSFFITGGGGYPFFPGYTLTTMLGVFLYALFFYKSKITLRNVFLAFIERCLGFYIVVPIKNTSGGMIVQGCLPTRITIDKVHHHTGFLFGCRLFPRIRKSVRLF